MQDKFSSGMNPCNMLLAQRLSQDRLRALYVTANEIKRRFPAASPDFIKRNLDTDSVVATPVHQPALCDRSVGKKEGEGLYPGRRLVRIKSYRLRLVDERNLEDKYFTDALQIAGILRDDSPKWCKVEVEQIKVGDPALERTVIEVSELE